MKNVAVVFGTRPEAIKLAPVIQRLRESEEVQCRVYVTAQHRQMLDQVLEVFDIKPDIDLDLMKPNQSLNGLLSAVLEKLDPVLAEEAPELLVVQGDTTTALGGALAGFHRRIPVAHVEAGLRSGSLEAPWPEEGNRILITRLATLHFAPTARNREALLLEGVPASRVFVTGNTVVDALQAACARIGAEPPVINGESLEGRTVVLITGHRRESYGEGFHSICEAIAILARRFPDALFVYPVHLNPMVSGPVFRALKDLPNVRLVAPLGYLDFIRLLRQATVVLTDSGGVQEEAPTFRKPVLVMRERTERSEAVDCGVARLVGTSTATIVQEMTRLLSNRLEREQMASRTNPFGDGTAADRIVRAIIASLTAPKTLVAALDAEETGGISAGVAAVGGAGE